MALEAVVENLVCRIEELGDAVSALQWAAVEDRPRRGDSVLVDIVGGISDDLLGLAREARECAADTRTALGPPLNFDQVRRLMTTCHERFNDLSQRFVSELLAYERIDELKQLGRERRGGWQAWSDEVTRSIGRCREPWHEANQALFLCWREIAERVGMASVSVQATSIGQKVTVASSCRAGPSATRRRSPDTNGPAIEPGDPSCI
jgi:hypothetical protein